MWPGRPLEGAGRRQKPNKSDATPQRFASSQKNYETAAEQAPIFWSPKIGAPLRSGLRVVFFEPRKRPQRERYFQRPRKIGGSRARGTRSGQNHGNETRGAPVCRSSRDSHEHVRLRPLFRCFFLCFFSVKVRVASTTRRRERPDHHDPRYLRIKVSPTKTSVQETEM